MGARTVTAKFTPTDTNLAPSEATKAVTVVRGQTTTTATAVYRDARTAWSARPSSRLRTALRSTATSSSC